MGMEQMSPLGIRQGPTWLQFYRALLKLMRKQSIIPEYAAWFFRAAPAVVFTCYATLGFLVPIFYLPGKNILAVSDLLR